MKQTILRLLTLGAVLAAFALPANAEESKRGFYEGDLAGGGRIVFFVQGNHALSTYLFDTAGQQAGFGGGAIADDRTFSLLTSLNTTITGSVTDSAVTANVGGQSITANHVAVFGPSDDVGGRFTATATSSTGSAFDVKIVIDSQNRIFMIAKQGATVLGGFGTVTIQPSPSPSPAVSVNREGESGGGGDPSPTPSPSPSASPGDDDGGDDHGHDFEDGDDQEDHHEDRNAESFDATFTLTLVTGETVTGTLTFSHGTLLGEFTLAGVTYTFRAPQESSENHLANISTRGFVNTGQGQLIGGFIITGGPKLVLIRALGPSMASAGVNPVLADPKLQLFQGQTMLAENNDWQTNANAAAISQHTLPPTDARESVLLIRLEPGQYTTVVTGADNGTGISLVEVYEIDRD
jgi:hypothetical protein